MPREDNPAAMNFFRQGPTRVVGHRGASAKAPENTFESFDRAEADGADGVELDVRLTLRRRGRRRSRSRDHRRRRRAPRRPADDGRAFGRRSPARPSCAAASRRFGRSCALRLLGALSRGAEAVPLAADRSPGVPRRGAPFAASSLRARPRPLLLRRAAPADPGDRAANRDLSQLRRLHLPADRALLARPAPGVRRHRSARLARHGPPDGRGARIGALGPRLDGERSRGRAADGRSGARPRSSRTTRASSGPPSAP